MVTIRWKLRAALGGFFLSMRPARAAGRGLRGAVKGWFRTAGVLTRANGWLERREVYGDHGMDQAWYAPGLVCTRLGAYQVRTRFSLGEWSTVSLCHCPGVCPLRGVTHSEAGRATTDELNGHSPETAGDEFGEVRGQIDEQIKGWLAEVGAADQQVADPRCSMDSGFDTATVLS